MRLLETIVLLCWHPEVGYEFFKVLGVFVSETLEKKLVLVLRTTSEIVGIVHTTVHAAVHQLVHAVHVVHIIVHVVRVIHVKAAFDIIVAIEYTGQRLICEG